METVNIGIHVKSDEHAAAIQAAVEHKAHIDAQARALLSELIATHGVEVCQLLTDLGAGDLYREIEIALKRVTAADDRLLRTIAQR